MQGWWAFLLLCTFFFCLAISNATSYDAYTNAVLLLFFCWKNPVRSSLWSLQLASCRRKNSISVLVCSEWLVSKWRFSFEGFIDSWLRTTLHCGFSIQLLVILVKPNLRYSSKYLRFFHCWGRIKRIFWISWRPPRKPFATALGVATHRLGTMVLKWIFTRFSLPPADWA